MKDLLLIRSPKAAVIWTAVLFLPLLLPVLAPELFLFSIMIVYFVTPWGMCVAGLTGGVLPMVLGAAAGIVTLLNLFGPMGAAVGALFLLPPLGAFVLALARKETFWRSAAMVVIALIAGQLAALLLLQSGIPQGDIYIAAGQAALDAVQNMEGRDAYLFLLANMGVLGVPDAFKNANVIVNGTILLPDALRQDLLLSLSALVARLLKSLVPGALIGQSVYSGVGAVALSQYFGLKNRERRHFLAPEGSAPEPFPDLSMPDVSQWHLPRGMGLKVGILAAGGLVSYITDSPPLVLAGLMMYSAFSAVYTIQGIALLNFMQKKRDVRPFWRKAVPLLLMAFVPQALLLLGVFDQLNGIRGLRPPKEQKEG